MTLKDIVKTYRDKCVLRSIAFCNTMQLHAKVNQFALDYRMGPISMTEEQITAEVEKNPDYHDAKAKYAESMILYQKKIEEIDDIFQKIKNAPYDIVDEDLKFRGSRWNECYRGFTELVCPACNGMYNFKDGKCTEDGTDQYVDDIEKKCAADNFTHGIPAPVIVPVVAPVRAQHFIEDDIFPPCIDRALYLSGFSSGYMGANVPCPGCLAKGSFNNGICFICKIRQYPRGSTNETVQRVRDEEQRKKCYNGILNLPCPSCNHTGTFLDGYCYNCRFGQYASIPIGLRIRKFFAKLRD